ncbi:biotin--[acetyl-CoA-carboxylase] ligase [Youngiibacter fragilis]|uniref:Biotin--acetyl-CoA-carboxylase ligase n=1 Tax=Youngiibacter fragilis 232.1 TaxID=994573 RepID=V7I038_9CLOT|nr:biotin--[acetyl-CoA-carboxylase] ligase [Youngiibacter fragilis]ETA79248.1 biotin--acetyl-CoA-carboxylase ligase [Youngiibacter fragilis 232.1]
MDDLDLGQISGHINTSWLGRTIVLVGSVDSTNSWLKERAEEGRAKDGTLVISKVQTGGRGRLGRSFHSPEGGLYMSFFIRKPDMKMDTSLATIAAAISARDAIHELCGIRPRLKWVNDVYIGDRKVGGILVEGKFDPVGRTMDHLVIGIGINVTTEEFPEELKDIASSIVNETGIRISRSLLCARIADNLEKMLRETIEDPEGLVEDYKGSLMYIGHEITVSSGGGVRPARLVGVDRKGGLVVRYLDAEYEVTSVISSGEVTIRGGSGNGA